MARLEFVASRFRWWTRAGVAAVLACGVCCAVPLIAALGGIGVASSVAAVLEGFELVWVGLAVLALAGAVALWIRRRRRRACRVPGGVVDMGLPEPDRRGQR